MTKTGSWIAGYWKPITIAVVSGTVMLFVGRAIERTNIYLGIPERLNMLDGRLKKVETDQEKILQEQEKKDEHQDIETRLNQSEINGLKIEITALRTETNVNTKLLQEVREDVKKLLNKQ